MDLIVTSSEDARVVRIRAGRRIYLAVQVKFYATFHRGSNSHQLQTYLPPPFLLVGQVQGTHRSDTPTPHPSTEQIPNPKHGRHRDRGLERGRDDIDEGFGHPSDSFRVVGGGSVRCLIEGDVYLVDKLWLCVLYI